ncbi:nitronate monooxygenase family protein [Frankia sp. AgB32]|uniref:NAD(P)H-dependent flavin oxidoreductase n=1 Tax=Frankia sp. AgB32 TaxID=631119 RepID=UPI00200D4BE6|nr:nitronate monooxygenase [Frankia sp. AgB32]MCK9893439.1 nitronate monooxygenase [Frankia sp. AgB32]
MRTTLAAALGLRVGLLQSGMGGVAGPDLACAVSEAGAGGCAGGYKLVDGALSAMLGRLVAGTDRPVGVNLIPEVVGSDELARQVAQVLDQTPPHVYLSLFGLADDAVLERITAAGRRLVVQIGTVQDGVRAARHGAIVVAQGVEAGGHLLGTPDRDDLIAELRALLPDACLVAAGGIGSPAQAARAVAAGADGVLLGTAFVVARESMAHPYFKTAVRTAGEADTVITDVYEIGWPGRRHRVLATDATRNPDQPRKFIGRTVVEGKAYVVPRYSAAVPTITTSGRVEEMAMYCGRSCADISQERQAADIVADFARVMQGAEQGRESTDARLREPVPYGPHLPRGHAPDPHA